MGTRHPITYKEIKPLKPLIKWAGGKTTLLPKLRELYEPHRHRTLVEPFAGGLSVTLGLRPARARVNDLNKHLINFYRQVRDGGITDTVADWMRNNEAVYYVARSRFNSLIQMDQWNTPEAAHLFWFLNRTGFNGLCRFNSIGIFNTPFGKYSKIVYSRDLAPYREALNDLIITSANFSDVVTEPGDWLYLDPPYDIAGFTSYTGDKFGWKEQQDLAALAAKHNGPVVASNAFSKRVVELYTSLGFKVEKIEMQRRISCDGNREPASEMLATKGL